MNARKLLVVDDVPEVRGFLLDALKEGYEVTVAASGEEALEKLEKTSFDVLITDIALPGMDGRALIERINKQADPVATVAISAYGEDSAGDDDINVLDYIAKPFTVERILRTVENACRFADLRRENRLLREQLRAQDKIRSLVGNSVPMQKIREKIRLVAPTRATILVTGESGTGKEMVAREIHRMSDRADKPFIGVDCASIPETMIENELFGYDSGLVALGSARSEGKFESADGGTLLLDEVGELTPAAQSRVLRVIQEGRFERVGGTTPVDVNVRIIATTSRDLKKQVKSGAFREDLFYKLNLVPIDMIPLRDRREDIPLLIHHFVESFSRENNKTPIHLSEGAVKKLCGAYWRGNVRELENVIERAVILAAGASLDENYFHFDDAREERLSRMEQTFRFGSIRDMEKLMILHRLQDNDQNRTRASKTLDISVRTLRNKLREYRESGTLPSEAAASPVAP